MTTTLVRPVRKQAAHANELEQELRHIRDLVFVRELLRERGASRDELRDCDAVIDEAHARIAEAAKQASAAYAA